MLHIYILHVRYIFQAHVHFFSFFFHDGIMTILFYYHHGGGCYAIVCTYIVCTPVGPPSDTTWYIPSDLTWYIHETAVGQRKHSLTHMKSFHGIYFMYVCEACISYEREFCAV